MLFRSQAFTLWRMIGLGKICNGLYFLQIHALDSQLSQLQFAASTKSSSFHSANSTVASVSNLTALQLWHCRLGHPSFDKMYSLHHFVPDFPDINKESHFCDVYPLAK